MTLLVEHVKEWANAHYEEGGWDVVSECWGDSDILKHLVSNNIRTKEQAIKSFEPLVAVWSERQADAINSAF